MAFSTDSLDGTTPTLASDMNNDAILKLFNPLYADLDPSGSFPAKRPLLAHYTSLAVLEKILETEEVWFSNPLLMNDIEEVRFGIGRGSNLVHDNADLRSACETPARVDLFNRAYEDCFQRFENEHAFDTYVFCLSEHDPKDFDGALSMWRGYGCNGNGAAIVFDTKQLEYREGSPLIFAKVKYGSVQQRTDGLNNLLDSFSLILTANKIPDDKLNIAAHALFERIKLFALFSKHNGFVEEKEWRFVYAPDRDAEKRLAPMFHYAIGPRGAEPKLRLKIAPIDGITASDLSLEKITERILLGPSISSPVAKKAILRMLDLHKKSSLGECVHASTIPFRAI